MPSKSGIERKRVFRYNLAVKSHFTLLHFFFTFFVLLFLYFYVMFHSTFLCLLLSHDYCVLFYFPSLSLPDFPDLHYFVFWDCFFFSFFWNFLNVWSPVSSRLKGALNRTKRSIRKPRPAFRKTRHPPRILSSRAPQPASQSERRGLPRTYTV